MDKERLDELDRLEKEWEDERRRLFRGFAWSSAAAIAIVVLFTSYLMMSSDDENERLAQQPPPAVTQSAPQDRPAEPGPLNSPSDEDKTR